jgi:hypothetical protein
VAVRASYAFFFRAGRNYGNRAYFPAARWTSPASSKSRSARATA